MEVYFKMIQGSLFLQTDPVPCERTACPGCPYGM